MAAEMMSILLDVSEGISAENCIGSIWSWKPASLPISVIRSTITPWMLLVLVSRNVKGTPVGVEPTLNTCCADTGATARTRAAAAAWTRRLKSILSLTNLGTGRGIPSNKKKVIARFAVQAYFHNREIMFTSSSNSQVIFMHLKEAV